MSAASTLDSKPGSSVAMPDRDSSTQVPTDDDQSSAVSGYPSTSGGDTMADEDDDDESSLPSDWEERINAQAEAEVIAAQARTNSAISDRRSSLSGFVVEDEDTMAPIMAMDTVSGISDVVMADAEQQSEQSSAAGTAGQPNDAKPAGDSDADVDSISLSGLGSEVPAGVQTPPLTATGVAHPAVALAPTVQAAPVPAPAPVNRSHAPPQQPLQHPARPLHPFSSASAFLQGDSDSSSEEDDDD
ncbi:hypothetical protein BCR44DRAFT_1426048 [Catenaria anguillulae PL171]|uniref:Uncharacterized protein n=1 Tax=Catenaria anguillulae PL171 TaxID=765915 RepID=A0A1Y2HZS6_9FUNG|nr:hypothetical protein BCR44DRAFT_1426048 [Catenaria anguillulae PL171]